jgi:hypothetical protein
MSGAAPMVRDSRRGGLPACRAGRDRDQSIQVEIARPRHAHDPAAHHHGDPVAEADQLARIRRGQDDARALSRETVDQRVDLRARADIDAHGRIVHQENPALLCQPAAQHDLLLVAARK